MKTTARATCTHPGCIESIFWSYDTRREAKDHAPRRAVWKCGRHSNPDRNLGIDRLEITTVRTNKKVMFDSNKVLGLFWDGTSGLTHGDGYRAAASDFPEGPRLIVTARIELPEESTINPQEP